MKTLCKKCNNVQQVPNEYRGERVKCKICKENFIAKPYKRPPIVVPTQEIAVAGRGCKNIFLKLQEKCPKAFKAGFLGTLGVITAIWITIYVIGPDSSWLRQTSKQRIIYSKPVEKQTMKPSLRDVVLTEYRFDVYPRYSSLAGSVLDAVTCVVWTHNQNPHWVHGFYIVELCDTQRVLLNTITRKGTFPDTPKPREVNICIWAKDIGDCFDDIDWDRSRILIAVEK